LQNAKIVI